MTSIMGVDLAANPVTARFRIAGHFDDPEARGCWNVPVGLSLDSRGQPARMRSSPAANGSS